MIARTRRRESVTPEQFAALIERDGGRCARDGAAVSGERGRDFSVQHRCPRGMGGSRNPKVHSLANYLLLCGSGTTGCHGWVESNRAAALASGWLVSRYADPAAEPVLMHGRGWVLLGVYGGWRPVEPDRQAVFGWDGPR